MKNWLTVLFFILVLGNACKHKQALTQVKPQTTRQQEIKKEEDGCEPCILFCQLIFHKASPLPHVALVSAEAVPGVLNIINREHHGPVNYKFLNEGEQILAEGNISNPLYFRVEVSDPDTRKLSSHLAYLDSAYKLIRIPYQKGMSHLKISFTDSLNQEHLLKLMPLNLKKS